MPLPVPPFVPSGSKGSLSTLTQPKHLPTTRIMPLSEPLVPPNVVTMLLFESSRLLSVVPAAFGVLVNAWCFWCPPGYSVHHHHHHYNVAERTQEWGRSCPPDRGDYFIAVLWVRALPCSRPCHHPWRAGTPYRTPVSQADHRTFASLACILFSSLHPHPSSRVTSYLLAGHPFHAGHRWKLRGERLVGRRQSHCSRKRALTVDHRPS